MYCKICGGMMLGDGYQDVLHCENAHWNDYGWLTPDSNPVYCNEVERRHCWNCDKVHKEVYCPFCGC